MNQQLPNEVEILNAALEKSGGDRIAYVEAATLGNAALRDKIEALLRACERGPDLLDDLALKFDAHTTAVKLKSGALIKGYEIIEQLGEGGCGAVYRAEQKQPLRRQVALKVIKAGMDTRNVIARFEAERQALAMMDHPNIAKVFDAGSTEAGRPYFVMELVEGLKITDYCRNEKLSIHERLSLFLQVCDAVQHAHQKGIIHRDLKPSNILVSLRNGVPAAQVIDFGIAKAIQGKLTNETIHTALHQFIGTPAYMSPEQADLSPDIDTRTDIYSLGVLLYEVLTGRPPFDNQELLTAGLDEMRRIIRAVEPKRPSAVALTTCRLSLPTDLDCIVLKCLEKERFRRYDTADAFAADLRRFLENEPILARPPSTAYRFRKFVSRNKLSFAAGITVIAALVGAVAVSSSQALNARRAERAAKAQAMIASEQTSLATKESENAKAVRDFLIENLLGVDCCGDAPDADALTFEATQALARKVARRIDGRFTNQPQTEAELRMALTRAFHSARDFKEVALQAEKTLAINLRFFGAGHSNVLDVIKELAFAKYQAGQRQEAFSVLTNAMARFEYGTNQLSTAEAAVAGTYGILLAWDGQASNALPWLQQAFAINKAADPKGIAAKAWKSKLAEATEWSGNLEAAERIWREVYEESASDLGAQSSFTIQQMKAYARLLLKRERWDTAQPLLERSAQLALAVYGKTNFSTLDAQFWLARAYERSDLARAKELYLQLQPLLTNYFPYSPAVSYNEDITKFFQRQDTRTNLMPTSSATRP